MNTLCPCGSNQSYSECCEPFITAKRLPDTPEQLMRSRYTAFTQANMDYIQQTMRGSATRDNDIESTRQWAKTVEWLGLEVLHTEIDPDKSTKGLVEFKASYRLNDKNQVLHERSLFEKIEDRWFYVGQAPHQNTLKIGRNDPCVCGSGKKYKKCCLI